MPISSVATWLPSADGRSRLRQVYRGGESIGWVRRWHEAELGELTREWFTAERMKDVLYVPIEGTHPTFEEAMDRIVLYGVRH